MTFNIFCDFDGTISTCDVADAIFEAFALPEWLQVEQEWKDGKIGSRECMRRQVELLRCDRGQLLDCLSRIDIDPNFHSFVTLCQQNRWGLFIVSDGIYFAIQTILGRYKLELPPIYANRLEPGGNSATANRRWRLEFPCADESCARGNGVCKCSLMRKHSRDGELNILIGDGRSDFCASGKADLVLAKDMLLEHCQALGLPHIGFRHFGHVIEILNTVAMSGLGQSRVSSTISCKHTNGVELL